MSHYQPRALEQKWQKIWETSKPWRAMNPGQEDFDSTQKPYYVLDMFPYPSGSGLHVGHASGYIGTDIVARKKRMEGYNVLHPMGWDAFGLPAEQYAIQTGQHPRATTDINTKQFRKQLKNIGLSYDWDREIDTSNKDYYRWTQWIFLQLYKAGLVYRKEMPVWWCEELKTVLANEEVINGRSERGNFICERRPLTQWVFQITKYADRLLEDLDDLDWPESIKKQQRDWIGKSLGAEVSFYIPGVRDSLSVFTTRPDTLFGVVALVLAPEHPLVAKIVTDEYRSQVESYTLMTKKKSERERKAEALSFSVQNTGGFAEHPLTKEKIPVWIADYVLADYGTGAVMAVPSHDERDFALAHQVGLPFRPVVVSMSSDQAAGQAAGHQEAEAAAMQAGKKCFTDDGVLVQSQEFSGLNSAQARIQITEKLRTLGLGQAKISYKIRDWVFSRQRYWGEPFPLLLDENDNVVMVEEIDLPVELPAMDDFQPSSDGSSPLARAREWVEVQGKSASGRKFFRVTDTMPGWAGSCWYYLRFMDPLNSQEPFSKEAVQYWNCVDLYVGGASHAVMHLLYARFWHKVLYDLKLVSAKEPFKKLFNQGMVTAFAYKDQRGSWVPSDQVKAMASSYAHVTTGAPVERFVTKMAKSLRNVINPDDVIEQKGCDNFRLYSMFMGPLDDEKPWAEDGILGCEKFLRRLWNFLVSENGTLHLQENASEKIERSLHKCLKRIEESFEAFNFNTAVAAMMESLNEILDSKERMTKAQMEMWVKFMFPFAPHFASEIWQLLGHQGLLDKARWPVLNPEILVESQFELVMQINGKVRKKGLVPIDLREDQALAMALNQLQLDPTKIRKVIFVPRKLINLVVQT